MFYPVAVMIVAVVILIVLMVYVVPKFKEVFEGMLEGQQLPAFTPQDVAPVDHEDDEASAHRPGVGAVVGRRDDTRWPGSGPERHERRGHKAPRRPVDLDREVVGGEVAHGPAILVEDADVDGDQLDPGLERGRRLRLLLFLGSEGGKSRQGQSDDADRDG